MASSDVQFGLLGIDELLGKFEEISFDVRRKGGRASLRKAAQVVERALKENAQSLDDPDTGRSIADNVALRWNGKLFKQSGDLGFRVGIMRGAVTPKKGQAVDKGANAPTPHWRLKEFGTENMPADPFARKALADHIAEVTGTFIDEYNRSLDRAIKRSRKRKAQTL